MEVSKRLKLLVKHQSSGWAQSCPGTTQEPNMWRCKMLFFGSSCVTRPQWAHRGSSAVALPHSTPSGTVPSQKAHPKVPARYIAAGLGDITWSPETLHKAHGLMAVGHTCPVRVQQPDGSLKAFDRSQGLKCTCKPNMNRHPFLHSIWNFLSDLKWVVFSSEVTKTFCKPVDWGVPLTSQVCMHATATVSWH